MNSVVYFLLTLLLGCWLLAGCSHTLSPMALNKTDSMALVELTSVPFFPMEDDQSGAAALATLLVNTDIVTLPDLLSPALLPESHQAPLPLELIAAIRSFDRIPYRLHPELAAISAELRAGRPVLVLQDAGFLLWPRYQYAVVIGERRDDSYILRSGTTPRLIVDRQHFLHSWDKGGRWALIALQPGELPADHDLARYLEAVARMEAIGKAELAEESYRAVLSLHPHNTSAVFGLASSMFSQGNYLTAAEFYSYLLRRDPKEAVAANNLAESLSALQCHQLALELLDTFLCKGCSRPAQRLMLTRTRDAIEERAKTGEQPKACQRLNHLLEF